MDEYVDAGAADAGALRGAAPDARSATGSTRPGRRVPGPEPRLAPRAGPLLRPLAEGRRQRRDGRAGRRPVPPRRDAGRSRSPSAWPGEWLAFDAWPPPGTTERVLHLASGAAAARRRAARRPSGRAGDRAVPPSSDDRDDGRRCRGAPVPRPTASAGISRPDEALIPVFTSAPLGRGARRHRGRGRRARLGIERADRHRRRPARRRGARRDAGPGDGRRSST